MDGGYGDGTNHFPDGAPKREPRRDSRPGSLREPAVYLGAVITILFIIFLVVMAIAT
jgi:hypothetical protein